MKPRLLWTLMFALPCMSQASEPLLLVEFEGRVIGNTLRCQPFGLGCPANNHFGAPWGEDSMVGEAMFDRVEGRVTVAYSRGEVSFNENDSFQRYEVRSDTYGPVNVVSGSISVGGTPVNIDRDYKGLITGGLKWRQFLDGFYISEPRLWRRAAFGLSSQTQSGHEYYGIVNEKRMLLRKFFASTSLNLNLDVFDLMPGNGFFGRLEPEALPSWQWESWDSARYSASSSIALRDFELKYTEESGQRSVSHTTSVRFTIDKLKVTSLNGQFTGPDPIKGEPDAPGEPGPPEGVPAPPQLGPVQ